MKITDYNTLPIFDLTHYEEKWDLLEQCSEENDSFSSSMNALEGYNTFVSMLQNPEVVENKEILDSATPSVVFGWAIKSLTEDLETKVDGELSDIDTKKISQLANEHFKILDKALSSVAS